MLRLANFLFWLLINEVLTGVPLLLYSSIFYTIQLVSDNETEDADNFFSQCPLKFAYTDTVIHQKCNVLVRAATTALVSWCFGNIFSF